MTVISYINQQWIPTGELTTQLIGIVIQAITVIVVAVSIIKSFSTLLFVSNALSIRMPLGT
jgi:hypothetical protein